MHWSIVDCANVLRKSAVSIIIIWHTFVRYMKRMFYVYIYTCTWCIDLEYGGHSMVCEDHLNRFRNDNCIQIRTNILIEWEKNTIYNIYAFNIWKSNYISMRNWRGYDVLSCHPHLRPTFVPYGHFQNRYKNTYILYMPHIHLYVYIYKQWCLWCYWAWKKSCMKTLHGWSRVIRRSKVEDENIKTKIHQKAPDFIISSITSLFYLLLLFILCCSSFLIYVEIRSSRLTDHSLY